MASYAVELVSQYVGPGGVIAIPRPFVTLCGDYEGAALLAQLLYWWAKMGQREFYKTDADLIEELGLSEYQLRRIRTTLEPLGVTTTRKGLPARLFYQIDTEVLGAALLKLSKGQLPPPEATPCNSKFLKNSGDSSLKIKGQALEETQELYIEQKITQETTTGEKAFVVDVEPPANVTPPDALPNGSRQDARSPRIDIEPLVDAYNLHRGGLPEVTILNDERRRKLRKLSAEHGAEAALALITDATRCVAADEFWCERRYNLDNLLRKVVEKAEKWRAAISTPAPGRRDAQPPHYPTTEEIMRRVLGEEGYRAVYEKTN